MPTLSDGPLGQWGRRSLSELRQAPGPFVGDFGPRLKFDIGRFRAEQIAPLAQFRPYVMGANILAVLVILWFGSGSVDNLWLTIWTVAQAALTAAVLHTWSRSRNFISSSRRTIGLIEAGSLAFAVLWAFPPLQLFPDAPRDTQHVITAIAFTASVTGAFALTRLPSASIAFTTVVSGAIFVGEIRHGEDIDLILGFIAVVIAFLMSLMSLALHHTLIRRAADNYEMNRQGEFISLLLKDFESCSSDLLWETDGTAKLVYFSDRLPQLVGLDARQLLGKTFQEAAVASPEAEGWDDFLKLSGNHVAIEALRLEVRRGTSSSDWWMVTAQPLRGHAGEFLGYRGVIRDISLERRAQLDLIKAKEEAERASSAKSQFLAITSHELKTPLNAIVGFSEMLVAQREGPLGSPVYSEYASTILQSSSHLRSIIADILDVTRIERGALSLVEQEMDAAEIFEIAYKMCREQAKAADIPLSISLDRTAEILGDMTRIRQVLINLITNAIKFSTPGKSAHLEIERSAEDGLAFVIEDHGIGIEAKDIERIFEPFEQGDTGASRRHAGIGLGLAIARRLARLHGGDVTLTSVPGAGTTARFSLPAERVKWPRPAAPSAAGSPGAA
ncbi:MAG: ATP-binding protein [Parvibaculaceae bacterium]